MHSRVIVKSYGQRVTHLSSLIILHSLHLIPGTRIGK